MGARAYSSCPLVLGAGQGQALGREEESSALASTSPRFFNFLVTEFLFLMTVHFTSGNSLWFSFQPIGFESFHENSSFLFHICTLKRTDILFQTALFC